MYVSPMRKRDGVLALLVKIQRLILEETDMPVPEPITLAERVEWGEGYQLQPNHTAENEDK